MCIDIRKYKISGAKQMENGKRNKKAGRLERTKLTGGVAAVCIILAVATCEGIYGRCQAEAASPLKTGIVDISLEEYQMVEGKELPWTDGPVLLPGMEISKIPRIKNNGNDCYVRAKLTFTGIAEGDLLEQGIYGWEQKWQKAKDGYYYYTGILPSAQSVDLFQGLGVPENFPEELEGQTLQLRIDVEAIQSANPTPDDQAPATGDFGDMGYVCLLLLTLVSLPVLLLSRRRGSVKKIKL